MSSIDKKQKLMIELMIADPEIFAKCIRIMQPVYFDKPLDRVVDYIGEHFEKHKGIADIDIIEAETGVELKKRKVEYDQITYTLDELEEFCQEAAMIKAINDSVDLVNDGNLAAVSVAVREALMVKIDNSVGIELFTNAGERIEGTDEDLDQRDIGIKELDILLNGVRRREVGVLFGGTGGGKSILLGNFAYQLSRQQLHGVVISLELKDLMYAKRLDCIFSGANIDKHKESIDEITNFYDDNGEDFGSVVIKYLKKGSNASDIRTVLMEYELKYGRKPDYICVDYLALMGLVGMNQQSMNKFDADEYKIFDLQSIAEDYDAYVFTAGQLNREGSDVLDLGPKHVAGGLSVINGSDWSIAMVASDEDMDNNQFQVKQLKIRNGAKTRHPIVLYRCPTTLRISSTPNYASPVTKRKVVKKPEETKAPEATGKNSKLKNLLNRSKK